MIPLLAIFLIGQIYYPNLSMETTPVEPPPTGQVMHLALGLEPSRPHAVFVDGDSIGAFVSTAGGTLQFHYRGGLDFEISAR